MARGAELARNDPGAFDASWKQVQPGDLATLVYTSGTTGHPKGVMDTHRAVLWMGESFRQLEGTPEVDAHIISYLPLAHAAERTSTHWIGILFGWTTWFCPDPTQVFAFAREVRPTRFAGVPRVLEKLRAAMERYQADLTQQVRDKDTKLRADNA